MKVVLLICVLCSIVLGMEAGSKLQEEAPNVPGHAGTSQAVATETGRPAKRTDIPSLAKPKAITTSSKETDSKAVDSLQQNDKTQVPPANTANSASTQARVKIKSTPLPDVPENERKVLLQKQKRREDLARQLAEILRRKIAERKGVKLENPDISIERAATEAEIKAEEQLMFDITGLVIEETMTPIGYSFYEYFTMHWTPPKTTVRDYNILITELASRLWGSRITVSVNESPVWSQSLRPRSSEIEETAQLAVITLQDYLMNFEKYQFQSVDMGGPGI